MTRHRGHKDSDDRRAVAFPSGRYGQLDGELAGKTIDSLSDANVRTIDDGSRRCAIKLGQI